MKNSSLVNQEIRVGIADYKVAYSPDTLITLGLGSCVGIVIYDYKLKIGGCLILCCRTVGNLIESPTR